jgi:hypothetical protein
MNKIFIVFLLNIFLSIFLNASVLTEKVENIIGTKDYKLHQSLIELIFKDQSAYIARGQIRYYKFFKALQENGLLNLHLNNPSEIEIEFRSLKEHFKSYKILNDTMQVIGYRYFFTKSMQIDDNKNLIWKIGYRAEYMLDPVVLISELRQNNCDVLKVENTSLNRWTYEVDCQDARLSNAIKIDKNERVKFQKPLRAYMLSIQDGKSLQVISRNLNNWFPNIVFFDEDLRVLKIIKRDRVYKGLTVKIPNDTKYVKITDMYNLINIKRGLSIIVR